MEGKHRIILGAAILALTVLACQSVTGGGDTGNDVPPSEVPPSPVATVEVVPTQPVLQESGNIIFSDDFSSQQWGTGMDIGSDIEYVDDTLNFVAYSGNVFVWSTPNDEVYKDIHMEATVINNGTDPETAFGFICNKSAGSDFYYLVITPGRQYAIVLAKDGAEDVFLTGDNNWAYSDLIAEDADQYRIGADCGNGTLTLYVDGQQIASVDDPTYSEGRVALMVWSAEEDGKAANVSFDDFVMTSLP